MPARITKTRTGKPTETIDRVTLYNECPHVQIETSPYAAQKFVLSAG
jgi:hypothetical protein